MEDKHREQLLKTRQRLLDLLKLSEWDLILEKYPEASEKIDKIKKTMDNLVATMVRDSL